MIEEGQVRPEVPVRTRAEWARFLLGFAVLLAVLMGTSALDATGRFGLLILTAVLVAGTAVEWVLSGSRAAQALRHLGLGWPSARALLVACAAGALVQLVYPITTSITAAMPRLRPDWPWLLIGIFAFHGVAEEVVWRGYAYRRLRVGRSFGHAVLWTMPLVAVAHVPILITSGPLVGVAALIVAAVTAVPLAYLFDRGRATIWAAAVVHTAIDSFKLVAVPAAALTTFSLLLAAVSVIIPLLVLAIPRTALSTGPTAPAPSGPWQAVRWPVGVVVVAGMLVALASELDTGSAAAREAARLIGAPTVWILLPLAATWLLFAALRYGHAHRRTARTGSTGTGSAWELETSPLRRNDKGV